MLMKINNLLFYFIFTALFDSYCCHLGARSVNTYNHASVSIQGHFVQGHFVQGHFVQGHFVRSHIRRVRECLAVNCHLAE